MAHPESNLAQLSSLEEAVLALTHRSEVTRFLLDLCTPAEIEALRQRWAIAQLLDNDLPQRKAAEQSDASIATVTRVARFLQHEQNRGYRLVLDRLRHAGKR
ncbi:MAG TPA: YerC/YecD family TrpR-related protein [Rhizomicrobium sp.]|jgi:TrpR-related protein YerC/YecD|nr:YerC/YecD family TrpR-related protein [Rhizomicrobium sp.]